MKQASAAILGLALSACAPAIPVLVMAPDPGLAAQPPPPSQVMDERAVTPREGAGAIVVTSQHKSWFAEGCTFDVSIDDQVVAGLRPGEAVTLFADPGQRILSFNVRDEAACSPASARLALEVVAHTTQKVRLGSDSHHDLKVEVDSYGRALPP